MDFVSFHAKLTRSRRRDMEFDVSLTSDLVFKMRSEPHSGIERISERLIYSAVSSALRYLLIFDILKKGLCPSVS